MTRSDATRDTSSVDIHISYCDTTGLGSAAVELAEQYLSSEERARGDRLHFEEDRRDFIVAHDLLRRALSRHIDVAPTDWRFAKNSLGKPSIKSADPRLKALSFSLSHTRGCVACATTEGVPVGIDVEAIGKLQSSQHLDRCIFSKKELSWLHYCSADMRGARLTELWTLKEAFLKATGVGLGGPLTAISFCLDRHSRIAFSAPSDFKAGEWHFALFEPVANLRLAVAVCEPRARFWLRDFENNGRTLAPIFASAT